MANRLNKFIEELNNLCEKYNLIIDKENKPSYLQVYWKKGYREIGKIEYDEITEQYLSLKQKEIRQEVKADIKDKKFLEVLNNLKKWQEQFLKEVVEQNTRIVSEEEALIYHTALDKIEDRYKDYQMWDEIRCHPEHYRWRKIKDLHWEVIDDGRVILEITKEDVLRYTDEDVLEKHYSKYL